VAICSAWSDREVLAQLKMEAAAWFGKANAGKLYREFKSVVAAALTAELEIHSIRQYLEISGREDADRRDTVGSAGSDPRG
jgi:hypothetical protein